MMCNLYSITTNQEAIVRLFRQVNRYVGNLAAMPSVFPDYPAPVVRSRRHRARTDHDALGNATTPEVRRSAGDQHQQYLVAALARLAEA